MQKQPENSNRCKTASGGGGEGREPYEALAALAKRADQICSAQRISSQNYTKCFFLKFIKTADCHLGPRTADIAASSPPIECRSSLRSS